MKKRIFILMTFAIFFSKSAYPSIQIEDNMRKDDLKNIMNALKKDLQAEQPNENDKPKQDIHTLHNLKGKYFYTRKEYQYALKEFKLAVNAKKDFAEGYNNMGLSYFRLELLDKAIESFENAVKYDPDYFEAYNNLGGAYLDLGDYNKAIVNFNKAKIYSPENKEINANLKQALELKNKRTINLLVLLACMITASIYLFVKVFSGRKT